MQFYDSLVDLFNSGDKEVRTWFLVRHNYLPFIICTIYVIFSYAIGPALMRNRKPFDLRWVMVFYNFCVVGIYIALLLLAVFRLPEVSWHIFCKGGVVKRGDVTYTLVRGVWVGYLLKYVEFLDTVFFILRKKENLVTFLHVVHHTIVPILGWVILRTETSGFQAIPGLLNTIVHVIMYTYYGLAAMGPQVRKYLWWKKYLTQLQMIQFVLMIFFVVVVAPLSGCTMNVLSYLMDYFFAPFFLFLFYRFYRSAFYPRKKSEKSE